MPKSVRQSSALDKPCVDVIIPAYNAEKTIKQCLDSVLSQTGSHVNKIFVIDDGSDDHTQQCVMNYRDPRFPIIYRYQKNSGLSHARNHGINLARAPYLAFLDSDDVWEKNKLQSQLEVFQNYKDPTLALVYCDYRLINFSGRVLPASHPDIKRHKSGHIYPELLKGNIIYGSGSGVLVKRSCFAHTGYFDETLPTCEDWDMWLRIAKKYQVSYVPKSLVKIRVSKSSLSQNPSKMVIGMCLLYQKHPSLLRSHDARQYFYSLISPLVVREYPQQTTLNLVKQHLSGPSYQSITRPSAALIAQLTRDLVHTGIRNLKYQLGLT